MEELYNALVEQGKYTKSFEDFKAQFSAPEKTKMLYESLNSSGDYTKSFENFTSQFGFAEKKNQVDTPSGGQEVPTESITETKTIPGSSDSLEEQGEVSVIPLVQDDNGDLTPFVEIPPVNQPDSVVVDTEEVEISIPEAPYRSGKLKNEDGSVSTHKMKTETDGQGNWFSFPTVFQNEDGSFVDMSEEAKQNWEPVYEEAKKRGEVIEFGTDEKSALAYGKGSWKNKFDVRNNLELLNSVGYIEAKGQNRNILDVLKEKGDERVDDIIMEKTYPVMENGQVVYKKEEEIAPELLDAMKIYDKSIDDSYKKNYDDVQVDFEDFQRDDIPDADKLQSLKINQEDYLKWDKVNTRQEGSVFKFFKTLLTSEEGDEFEKEQRQYEKVQSYQATVLNGITNDLEKNKAQQKLTTDTQALKELRKEEELLTGNFYETLGTINSAIDLFPKFKELTEETDLKKRRRLFFAAKNGGMNEFEEGVRQKIRMGGGTAVNYATKFFAGIPGFFDQRLSAVGYDKKGLLAGLSDMLSDSAEHYDIDYGATNRSAFIDGKPVTYKGEEFFVDSNGKVYDKETNLLMDGIIGQDAIKEIQQRSKNVPNAELQFTGGSVLDGTTGTLLNLFALIKSGGKVNKALNLEKRLGKKLAGKVGMGLASFTSGVVDNVEDIRSQLMATGMSEKEAMNIAVNAGQAISTLDGVFSGIAGSNEKLLTGFQGIKDQIKNLAINKGKDFTRKQLTDKGFSLTKEFLRETGFEEIPVYFSEKAINNLVNRRIGNDVLDDNITRAGITETVVMTIGATSALGSRKLLTGNKRADLVRLAAKNVENLQETLDALVKEGSLTKKEAMSAYTEIYNMQTAENKTKGTIVVSENMQEASDLLTQRQNLINQKQGLEGPLKENIDKRIADVDAQLNALYKKDKQQARDIIKGEQEGTIDVTVTREEALESLKAENEANKRLGLPTILESDENILKEQNKLIKERQVLTLKDEPDFTKEAVASLKEEGIDDPTLNQVADRAEQLTKQKEDAISKPSTEEQVLPDAPTSTEGGKDSEVELQQVGEGDVEQVTPDTQVQEGETQTDKPSDKTAEGDVEQVSILNESINASDSQGRKGLVPVSELESFVGEDRLGDAAMPNSRETIDKLKEDIKKNGFKEPIVVLYDKFSNGGEATIIEGNHRYAAAKELGLKEIPVTFEKGTIRSNEKRAKDQMFPLNRKPIGKINDTRGVKGSDLGLTVRQPTDIDFVQEAKTESQPTLTKKPKTNEKTKQQVQSKRSRDGGTGRTAISKTTPLQGTPIIKGATGPDIQLVSVAEKYANDNNIELKRQGEYVEVDPVRAKRIADAYTEMANDPQNPKVKEAYAELIKQTKAQYEALVEAGYKFWFIDLNNSKNIEYISSPFNAMRDLRKNKEMGVFPTDLGFGSDEDVDVSQNPLLEDTGLKWPVGGLNGETKSVTANDLFRAVHDAFGHGLEGAGFRARGEENAWQAHSRLFTGAAIGAMTSETRGQNSWVNFGPNGESNRTASAEDTVFADQKVGLMPEWTWSEGRSEDMQSPKVMSVNKEKYQVPGSRTIDVEVDKNGKPTVVSRKTGKKVDKIPVKAQDFILTNVVDVNDGARADISEGSTPEQVVDQISENSNNIKEVSETIDQLRKEEENTQESKDVGGELGGLVNQKTRRPAIKFTAKSWKRVTGLSPKESGVSSSWIATEANGGVSIEDRYSDVLSLPGELPVDTNQRISSDQVVEFIKQYPNSTALKEANTSTQLTDLEIKFEQLTGLKATPRNIKTVVGIDPNREPIALTKERSKESTTKESAEKESEGVSKLRDALRKSGTTVKRNTAEQISKLGKQIENAKKALSKILPDVEIIMPSSEAEYKRLTGESNTDNSGGTYIDGKIYINPNRASSRVVSHEVFHAVLLSKGMSEAQAKAITERMLSSVKKSASKKLLDKIDKFSKRYPEALQSEESIAELVGILASEYDTLPKPSQNIVKRWLDKLAKIFGLKPFTDVEVVDLLNTLASKVESGQEVSAKDVKILDGKDSKQKTEARKSSSKPTIEEIVSKGKEIGSSDADIREVAQQEGYANKDTNSEIEKYDTKKREAAQKAEKLFVKGGKIAKSLDFLRRWALSARGFLPKSMQIGKEVLTGAVAANAKQAENNLKDLQRYIKKQKKSVQDKLVQDLNSYMRGDTDIDTLPAKLRPIAYAMRNHIDSLSMSLVESGAITDIKFDELSPKQKKELIKEFGTEEEARKNYKSQKDNIIDNLGSYLNRSFEVFDNKDYSPSDAVLNAAKAKLREQYMEAAKEKALEENNDVDAVLEEMVDNALEKILSREEGREFLNSSKLGSKNISVLKEKIDIPAEIRALMGEYTDPALNYVRSVNKIAALVANQEFLSEMKKAGEGVFFFNKPTGEYNVLIAPKGSKTYNPLNGMYTSKAIKDVVLNTPGATINDSVLNNLLNFYYKMVGIVKYSKTILSPATHAKNVIGNLFFMAYNGYTNPKVYFDAANVVFSDLRSKDKKNHREKMQEYIKAGIINQSSNLGEIRALLQNEGSLEDIMVKRMNSDSTLFERLNRIRKKIGKGAEATYQAEDDVFKIISFEMEKKRYSKALFNKTFDKLSPEQQKEVTDKVTEIVKNILPNYSRIGGIGKFLKAVPIAGTFISFQIEAMRTAYNVANLALSELKDINTAGIGVKRLTGILSVTALKAAILPMLGVAGQTLTEAIKSAIGDEEEEEEKEGDIITKSARHFLPKWAENSNIIITKLDNGKFEYVNFSASDPHGFIDKAIISAFRGETAVQGMGNAIISLTEPFVTPDILFKAITSTETDYGKQIFNETDTPNEIAKKIGGILYTTFEPGGATSARKLFKAYKDEDKSLKNEILGQTTGFKFHTVDFEKQLIFKSLDLRKRVDLASKDYSKAYYERKNKEISEDDLRERYNVSNDKYQSVMKEGVDLYKSALRLGSSRYKIEKKMEGYKKLTLREFSYIRNGKIPKLQKKKRASILD